MALSFYPDGISRTEALRALLAHQEAPPSRWAWWGEIARLWARWWRWEHRWGRR